MKTLTHEERLRLVYAPFPQTRRIDPRHWGGVQTYPNGFEGSLVESLQPGVKVGIGNRVYGRRKFAAGEEE